MKRLLPVLALLYSLLAWLPIPIRFLWIPAIAASEGGHYGAVACVFASWLTWRRSARWIPILWLGAALLFTGPAARAWLVGRRLPSEIEAAFGPSSPRGAPGAPARRAPIHWTDLFRGLPSPPVERRTRYFWAKTGEQLAIDVYEPPAREGLVPAVLVVHGGSWSAGDRREVTALNRYLAARGYLVAAMDYRLAPRHPFPAARDDLFEALRFLHWHAAELGWNGREVVLLGRSAGGQIALSAAYAQRDPALRGVISLYGPTDLVFAYAHPSNPLVLNSRAILESYLGGPPGKVPGQYEAASPLAFVNAWTPPTLLIHGGRDELVWPGHAERLARRLASAGRPHYFLSLPWATHGCDVLLNGPSGQLAVYAIERFLAAVMPTDSPGRLARFQSRLPVAFARPV